MRALWNGHANIARVLLDKGADPEAANDVEFSAYDCAVECGYPACRELMESVLED
jgi:ankyrin repeat protein